MWIEHVAYEDADGRLKELYDRVKGHDDNVDNIMLAHSLRPHSMEGHMTLYKRVLHHSSNKTPKWFLETIGVFVSLLNGCDYCVEHHFSGLKRLMKDDDLADRIFAVLNSGSVESNELDAAQQKALIYARTLTTDPKSSQLESNVSAMREAGWDDGGILEINQVVSYFNYANRTVVGLGVSTSGDILGLSPGNSDSPDDWSHR